MILHQNKHILATGRLPRDAEFRVGGQKNSHFCSFGVAADEYYDEAGQKQTTWVNVEAKFELADAARNLKKGDYVLVTGKMVSRKYHTREGEERITNELQADFVLPLIPTRSVADLKAAFPNVVTEDSAGLDSAFAELDGGDGELPF